MGSLRPPTLIIHYNEQDVEVAGFQEDVEDEETTETEDEDDAHDGTEAGQEETLAERAMNSALWSEVNKNELNGECLKDDDEKVQYYTGLSSFALLRFVLDQAKPYLPEVENLSHFQMVLATLMRLRLGLPVKHLCPLFEVSHETLSTVFEDTIHILYARLNFLVLWPERHILQATKPHEFTETFGNSIVFIIKCLEIRIERPSRLKARLQTFSLWEGTHTIKYVMALTPLGAVSLLSEGWGGLATDKQVLEKSGLLDKLLPGDVLLADRGLDVRDAEMMCAEVQSPSLTNAPRQLRPKDNDVSHLREHVQSVVSNASDKFKILHSRIPVDLLLPCEGEEITFMDKIVTVCCVLVNTCPSPVLPH